jgi:hypothetical protein
VSRKRLLRISFCNSPTVLLQSPCSSMLGWSSRDRPGCLEFCTMHHVYVCMYVRMCVRLFAGFQEGEYLSVQMPNLDAGSQSRLQAARSKRGSTMIYVTSTSLSLPPLQSPISFSPLDASKLSPRQHSMLVGGCSNICPAGHYDQTRSLPVSLSLFIPTFES